MKQSLYSRYSILTENATFIVTLLIILVRNIGVHAENLPIWDENTDILREYNHSYKLIPPQYRSYYNALHTHVPRPRYERDCISGRDNHANNDIIATCNIAHAITELIINVGLPQHNCVLYQRICSRNLKGLIQLLYSGKVNKPGRYMTDCYHVTLCNHNKSPALDYYYQNSDGRAIEEAMSGLRRKCHIATTKPHCYRLLFLRDIGNRNILNFEELVEDMNITKILRTSDILRMTQCDIFRAVYECEETVAVYGAELIYPVLAGRSVIALNPNTHVDQFYRGLMNFTRSGMTISQHPIATAARCWDDVHNEVIYGYRFLQIVYNPSAAAVPYLEWLRESELNVTRAIIDKNRAHVVATITNHCKNILRSDSLFVYYHQRRTGGTPLSQAIQRSFQKIGGDKKRSWIGSSLSPNPRTPQPEELIEKQLIVGHVDVETIDSHMLRMKDKGIGIHYSCISSWRHPVDRLRSCIASQFGGSAESMVRLLETEYDTLVSFLVNNTDASGKTCLSEPFRILSGVPQEPVLLQTALQPDLPSSRLVVQKTMQSTNRCTPVMLLEDPELAKRLLLVEMPWLDMSFMRNPPSSRRIDFKGAMKERLIMGILRSEMEVYEYAVLVARKKIKEHSRKSVKEDEMIAATFRAT